MNQPTPPAIKTILTEMATLTTMERGKLSEEYRTAPASEGSGSVRFGPYYKLQAWENGRNASRRVPASEVPALQQDLANHQRFAELAGAFVQETIGRTRALRRSENLSQESIVAKKNSAKKPAAKDTRKRKPSSPKSKRA